jgi:hypothetical protein
MEQVSRLRVAAVPVHLDVHPLRDYEPIGKTDSAWIGSCRQPSSHRVVVVRRSSHFSNIARLTALYCVGSELYVIYEHVEFDILDLVPLSLDEIATVASQVPSNQSHSDSLR